MKCFTVYACSASMLRWEQGISVVKDLSISSHPYILRLGINGFLANEARISLMGEESQPDILTSDSGQKIITNAFPLEIGKGTPNHRYALCKPSKRDDGVYLVRFAFGKQSPEPMRRDVFPVEGYPTLIALATCALGRGPWPRFGIDGLWATNINDVFSVSTRTTDNRVIIKENGIEIQ